MVNFDLGTRLGVLNLRFEVFVRFLIRSQRVRLEVPSQV